MKNYDIIIGGGGQVGLSFAASMAGTKMRVLVVEKSALETIKNPKPDGKETALTHLSVDILKKMHIWERLEKTKISPIKSAKVFDGNTPLLNFKPPASIAALGYLVPNHLLKKALYERIATAENIDIETGTKIEGIEQNPGDVKILCAGKKKYQTQLLVAADSRFSPLRQMVGIASSVRDFAKTMLVFEMKIEKSHNHEALEYFHYDKTLALLPLAENRVSVILTVGENCAAEWLKMAKTKLGAKMTDAFGGRFGAMSEIGKRHHYRLVCGHAETLIDRRFALIGDAAAATHPVTAHGFNLGLRGQDILAEQIKKAARLRADIGGERLLREYQKRQIYLSKMMYFGTNGIVALFTNNAAHLRPLRRFVLRFAEHVPPVKRLITHQLTATHFRRLLPF